MHSCIYSFNSFINLFLRDQGRADALVQGHVPATPEGTFIHLHIVYVCMKILVYRNAATLHLLTCVVM